MVRPIAVQMQKKHHNNKLCYHLAAIGAYVLFIEYTLQLACLKIQIIWRIPK